MAEPKGGFLIRFDEAQRTMYLVEGMDLDVGFSDALSRKDWAIRGWEVCGLIFEADRVGYWALARRGKGVATGKVRVEFARLAQTEISIADVEGLTGGQVRDRIGSARSGIGGRIPPATWEALKRAVGTLNQASLRSLLELERLRDASVRPITKPGAAIVAQERDAVGIAMDAFDESRKLRKRTLKAWVPGEGKLTSFLDGLPPIRTIEDQLVARDASLFPGSSETRHTVLGSVFRVGSRALEVFNVNRTAIEESVGVDLLYWNEEFGAWTLLQYKCMEGSASGAFGSAEYRPDKRFDTELGRMQAFRKATPDVWTTADGAGAYRLCGDGFFFKLCPRFQLEVLSDTLVPGMYLPREFSEAVLDGPTGPRGGRLLSVGTTRRHINNTLFADLVRDGWVGTRGVSSGRISEIVRDALESGSAVVVARARASNVPANLTETLGAIGMS